ncbi:CCA tRNA nucleotidyltransferase, partial [Paenibacillus sepulcri]|nr:CCA tRNA nucleotidyltransferase [Paenibacillus sepulcri]
MRSIWNESLTAALPVLQTLESHGFEAVFVGGCVRDSLLGRPLKDVDIATAATPDQVMELFGRTIPTGLQHGTVSVILNDELYEVTTFRTESDYEGFRRPASVQFVSELEADLQRRDFTINAMALRSNGELVDPMNGMEDIRRGILRCVGDPDTRFQEDALRMIRAVRFAAEFKLRIALGTWRAMKRHRGLLVHIAMERIGAECDKMVGGAQPDRAGAWLISSGLMDYTKAPLPAALKDRRWTRTAGEIFADFPHIVDLDDRWAAVCISMALSRQDALQLFQAFRFSVKRTAHLSSVIAVQASMMEAIEACLLREDIKRDELDRKWKLLILQQGKPACSAWLRISGVLPMLIAGGIDSSEKRNSDTADHGRTLTARNESLIAHLAHELSALPAAELSELAVDGSDILQRLRK